MIEDLRTQLAATIDLPLARWSTAAAANDGCLNDIADALLERFVISPRTEDGATNAVPSIDAFGTAVPITVDLIDAAVDRDDSLLLRDIAYALWAVISPRDQTRDETPEEDLSEVADLRRSHARLLILHGEQRARIAQLESLKARMDALLASGVSVPPQPRAVDDLRFALEHATEQIAELSDALTRTQAENERQQAALIEIDTYLANDPDVWRIVSVSKVGDVLCDALGAETVQQINEGVEISLIPGATAGKLRNSAALLGYAAKKAGTALDDGQQDAVTRGIASLEAWASFLDSRAQAENERLKG